MVVEEGEEESPSGSGAGVWERFSAPACGVSPSLPVFTVPYVMGAFVVGRGEEGGKTEGVGEGRGGRVAVSEVGSEARFTLLPMTGDGEDEVDKTEGEDCK